MDEMIERIANRYPANEPIFTCEVFALLNDVPRSTVYYQLKKAVEKGILSKVRRGVYFLPSQTILGQSVVSPLKMLVKKYIFDDGEVKGYWGGLMLENQEGLTTQDPTILEIVTNKATKRLTRLGAFEGYRDVLIRPPRVKVTSENIGVLKFLDLVGEVSDISDARTQKVLSALAESLDAASVLGMLRYYPSTTSKRLIESGLLHVST